MIIREFGDHDQFAPIDATRRLLFNVAGSILSILFHASSDDYDDLTMQNRRILYLLREHFLTGFFTLSPGWNALEQRVDTGRIRRLKNLFLELREALENDGDTRSVLQRITLVFNATPELTLPFVYFLAKFSALSFPEFELLNDPALIAQMEIRWGKNVENAKWSHTVIITEANGYGTLDLEVRPAHPSDERNVLVFRKEDAEST